MIKEVNLPRVRLPTLNFAMIPGQHSGFKEFVHSLAK